MVPLKKSTRQSILALLWCAASMLAVGLLDAATESQVSDLMSRMSPEEKLGQIIQADIGHITPEELRRYPLGAVISRTVNRSTPGGARHSRQAAAARS
jgi:beta-glucosidase